jgi:hypothetical protein
MTTCNKCGGNEEWCNCTVFVLDRKGNKIFIGDTIRDYFSYATKEYLEGIVVSLKEDCSDALAYKVTKIATSLNGFYVGKKEWDHATRNIEKVMK